MSHHHGSGSSGMDMGGMDMGDMMSMSSGMFKPEAFRITKIYWYLICAIVGVLLIANVYDIINARLRNREARANPDSRPAMPRNQFTQCYATVQTMFREMSYPQGLYWTKRGFAWLSPPSIGRVLVLVVYWITITIMLTANAVHDDAYYFERLGFRAAWISIMQVPFIVILSTKVNIIGLLIGSSYERLNWLHRWVGRTLWVCVTIHGGSFLAEWVKADFLAYELEILPMVKYGMGAWGVLTWINISSLLPIRSFAYEIFVLQHIASGALFIWLIYEHAPEYAHQYIWITVGFMVFDRVARWAWLGFRNVNVFQTHGALSRLSDRVGYRTELQVVPGNTTRITIKNVPFTWKAGQHIYLSIPRLGFFEAHPFTISNTCHKSESSPFSSATIAVRAHGGFSKRLHNYALKHSSSDAGTEVRAFIQGPFGNPPTWNAYDTVVLISASTGCSFTLPILEDILNDPGCVKHVTFMLLVRERPQCSCYMERLRDAAAQASKIGLLVRIQIVVTGKEMAGQGGFDGDVASRCVCGPDTPASACCCGGGHTDTTVGKDGLTTMTTAISDEERMIAPPGASCCSPAPQATINCCADPSVEEKDSITRIESRSSSDDAAQEKASLQARESRLAPPPAPQKGALTYHANQRLSRLSSLYASSAPSSTLEKPYVDFSAPGARPDLGAYIRYPIEEALGESLVVCCGGRALSGRVRNVVAALSDERGVHKGTGALGIRLFVEEFGY